MNSIIKINVNYQVDLEISGISLRRNIKIKHQN